MAQPPSPPSGEDFSPADRLVAEMLDHTRSLDERTRSLSDLTRLAATDEEFTREVLSAYQGRAPAWDERLYVAVAQEYFYDIDMGKGPPVPDDPHHQSGPRLARLMLAVLVWYKRSGFRHLEVDISDDDIQPLLCAARRHVTTICLNCKRDTAVGTPSVRWEAHHARIGELIGQCEKLFSLELDGGACVPALLMAVAPHARTLFLLRVTFRNSAAVRVDVQWRFPSRIIGLFVKTSGESNTEELVRAIERDCSQLEILDLRLKGSEGAAASGTLSGYSPAGTAKEALPAPSVTASMLRRQPRLVMLGLSDTELAEPILSALHGLPRLGKLTLYGCSTDALLARAITGLGRCRRLDTISFVSGDHEQQRDPAEPGPRLDLSRAAIDAILQHRARSVSRSAWNVVVAGVMRTRERRLQAHESGMKRSVRGMGMMAHVPVAVLHVIGSFLDSEPLPLEIECD